MNCSVTGQVIHISELASGVGGNGKPWSRLEFILEEPGQYPTKVELKFFNEKAESADFVVGDTITVNFVVESKSPKGDRWFTECKAINWSYPNQRSSQANNPPQQGNPRGW